MVFYHPALRKIGHFWQFWTTFETFLEVDKSHANKTLTRISRPPQEVVCDDTNALLSAIAKTFGESMDIKSYKESLWSLVQGCELPRYYIRNDVAHLLQALERSKCPKQAPRRVKDHYMRCLRFLEEATTLEISRDPCLHLHRVYGRERWHVGMRTRTVRSAAESRKYLINLISGIQENIEEDGDVNEPEEEVDDEEVPPFMQEWLDEIAEESRTQASIPGKSECPFQRRFQKSLSKPVKKKPHFVVFGACGPF